MDLEEVIKEIEQDQLFQRGITSKIFKSMLNQPSLVSINSANAVKTESENGYYTFKVDFTRPILDVDTIQLLTTSIPQANASIPNTAITFWYYRLSQYSGTAPSLNNLYCVRLLPSYYKPEFINDPETYGWNKTFNSYPRLRDELVKSCERDLGYDNLEILKDSENPQPYQYINFPILPGDISITYNSTYNKFQMTGNTTKLATAEWSNATTYALGSVIYYISNRTYTYTSLQNGNLNQNPESSPLWWKRTYNEIVAPWKSTSRYEFLNIVQSGGVLYRATRDSLNNPPPNVTYWENFSAISPTPIIYNYLITGYDDPNVAKRQGELFQMPYNPSHYYQTADRVFTANRVFQALTETSIYTPGNIDQDDETKPIVYNAGVYRRRVANQPVQNWTILTPNPTNVPIWSQYQAYRVGDLVYDNDLMFKCLIANTNAEPTANLSNGTWILQAQHPYNATEWQEVANLYNFGDCAYFFGTLWMANQSTDVSPSEPTWTAVGRKVWQNFNYDNGAEYYQNDVVYFNGRYYERNATTLNANPPVALWDINTFYPANAIVQNSNQLFRCLIPNQRNTPVYLVDTWSAATTYEVGQTAVAGGVQYTCQVKHLNLNPTNPIPSWSNANAYVPWNIAFVPGVQSYRCTNPVGPSPTPPNGDGGNWQGVFGGNNITSVWVPSNVLYWQRFAESNWNQITAPRAETSGLFGLSSTYDFVEYYERTGQTLELVSFPNGIPGQPFNPSPERLLNSILGFTWNGIFSIDDLFYLETNDVGVNIDAKNVTLFNRMRPVPVYKVVTQVPVALELEDTPTAIATRTYTAEGYANLVYSSIVNIYTNIVSGSTLDTIRNTNLVATTSMNCGNLGIAFHGNYIDTPLQRVAGDINELTIELRDEVGEPFFLTNNAIMTATFKITYKDGNVRIEEPA